MFEAAPVNAGDVLAGKYRVDRVLGHGGIGVVVAATHLQLEQQVALKFLLPNYATSAAALERFAREARAAAKLKSEHVAKVLDVGSLENGAPYIVMEFLEGRDLAAHLAERMRLPLSEAVDYVLQACEALAEAHALGIVHRDLKPANLFVTSAADGTPSVKILDFGIAKITTRTGSDQSLTATSALVGSPLYMSPEQLESSKDVDLRSDIWSVGAILFELVTGRTPFEAPSLPQLCVAVIKHPAVPPSSCLPGLPPAFDAVVMHCLEKDPARRFGSVQELAHALAQFASPGARTLVDRISRVTATRLGTSSGSNPPPTRAGALDATLPMESPSLVELAGPTSTAHTADVLGQTSQSWHASRAGSEPAKASRALPIVLALGLVVLAVSLVGVGLVWARLHRETPTAPATTAAPTASQTTSAETVPTVAPTAAPSATVAASASAETSASAPRHSTSPPGTGKKTVPTPGGGAAWGSRE